MAQSMSHAVIDAYVEKIKNHEPISDFDIESLSAEISGNDSEIHILETEMAKIRQPLIDELAQVINEMPEMIKYNSDPGSFSTAENHNRFEKLGIKKYTFVYKRTATWDWHPIEVGVLVPKTIDWDKDVGVIVKWHGGAFGTSSWEFEPWFGAHYLRLATAQNAIIVAPDYRLMPGACGSQILTDVDDFWRWFHGHCFLSPHNSLASALQSIHPGACPNLERLLIVGDSAGAFLAVYSWLTYLGSFRALYLTYPMLAYYHWSAALDDPNYATEYRGCPITRQEADAGVDEILCKISELKAKHRLPSITKRIPPDGGPGNAKLAMSDRWKELFCCESSMPDILGRIEEMREKGEKPRCRPDIFVHHGYDDPQCSIAETKLFLSQVREWYAGSEAKVHFTEVREIESKETDKDIVGHGYDHDLDEGKERWLANMVDGIVGVWGLNGSSTDHLYSSIQTS